MSGWSDPMPGAFAAGVRHVQDTYKEMLDLTTDSEGTVDPGAAAQLTHAATLYALFAHLDDKICMGVRHGLFGAHATDDECIVSSDQADATRAIAEGLDTLAKTLKAKPHGPVK